VQHDAAFSQDSLEALQGFPIRPDCLGRTAILAAVGCQRPGGFAHRPFHRVQAVGAIGQVGGADILAGGKQVVALARDQGAQRDLEGQGRRAEGTLVSHTGMHVDWIPAGAN